MRDLVYYVAVTIDGFIAAPDGDAGFFPTEPETVAAQFARYPEACPAHLREAFGVDRPPARFDTVLMGASTYRPAREAGVVSPYPDLRQYVVTHGELPAAPALEAVSGDVAGFVRRLKSEPGRDIWLCGGGDLAGQLRDEIDEIQLKVNPVLAGAGIPLVAGGFAPSAWRHVATEVLPGGVPFHTYRRPAGES